MKILFHVEPLIEMNRPYWKETWATQFSTQICNSLIKIEEVNFEFKIILNEPLATRFNHREVEKIVISQEEIFAAYNTRHYLDISVSLQNGQYNSNQLSALCGLYQDKLGGFLPDIVVCFSAVPYLKKLFPDAVILHQEFSIFSRKPFPFTWFFDPMGMFDKTLGNSFSNKFATLSMSKQEQERLCVFKDHCHSLIRKADPFKDIVRQVKQHYEKLLLLPLQFSSYSAFDSFVSYKSQYDYLVDVLEHIPKNVGLIVTTHPDYNILTNDVVDYLSQKYDAFVYSYEFEHYYAPSQYLLAHVDAVICVSSTIGLQTLLWNTKLISLGGVWRYIADGDSLNDIETVLALPNRDRDATLNWILTRYAITQSDIENSQWLYRFFQTCIHKQSMGIDFDFFEPKNEINHVYDELTRMLSDDIPQVSSSYSYERAVALVHACKKKEGLLKDELRKAIVQINNRDESLDILSSKIQGIGNLVQSILASCGDLEVLLSAAQMCNDMGLQKTVHSLIAKANQLYPENKQLIDDFVHQAAKD